MLRALLLTSMIVWLLAALSIWPYNTGEGPSPSNPFGVILLVGIILLVVGVI